MHTTIDTDAARRIETVEAQLADAGIAFKTPTFFAHGTRMIQAGTDRYRQIREELDARQRAHLLQDEIDLAYAGEKRQDIAVELPDVRMDDTTGRIYRVSANGAGARLPVSTYALGQLVSRAGAPGLPGGYLAACPPALRAENANHWLARAVEGEGKRAGNGLKATLRTKLETVGSNGNAATRRSVFACVGTRFSTEADYPHAVRAFLKAIPAHAKGQWIHDGRRWRFRASFPSDVLPQDARVGDVFVASLWIEGVDDGSGSIKLGVDAERVACINCGTIATEDVAGSVRHVGRTVLDKIAGLTAKLNAKLAPFAGAWAKARAEQIIGTAADVTPEHVFGQLVEQGLVDVSGVSDEELTARLVRAWQQEPGYSKADLWNAITRAAHTEAWRSPWQTAELEEQAGELLYQRVSIAPPAAQAAAQTDAGARFAGVEID